MVASTWDCLTSGCTTNTYRLKRDKAKSERGCRAVRIRKIKILECRWGEPFHAYPHTQLCLLKDLKFLNACEGGEGGTFKCLPPHVAVAPFKRHSAWLSPIADKIINLLYFLRKPAFRYRLNAVSPVMAVGLTIEKHSQDLNTRWGNTYLHLLGMEADGGGLGNTLAISDTWCSLDFKVLIFRASGVIPRPPDWGFSLRR